MFNIISIVIIVHFQNFVLLLICSGNIHFSYSLRPAVLDSSTPAPFETLSLRTNSNLSVYRISVKDKIPPDIIDYNRYKATLSIVTYRNNACVSNAGRKNFPWSIVEPIEKPARSDIMNLMQKSPDFLHNKEKNYN